MIEFPTCYVLRHKKHGTYVPNMKVSYSFADNILDRYENDSKWGKCFFTDKISSAKLWSSLSKIKRHLTLDKAKHYDIVGSDQSIIPATDLFKVV